MKQTPEELQRISARTLAHYDQNAQAFWDGTRDHDVSQNIAALVQHIASAAPFQVLDFGCGPGRDLMRFKALGHRATGRGGAGDSEGWADANLGTVVRNGLFLFLGSPSEALDSENGN